jgi:nuclear pore complex protein Nup98-Nup96
MTRFRAYASDDSESSSSEHEEVVKDVVQREESGSEEEEDSEEDESSDSDMDEDEPPTALPRRRRGAGNALIEGEDGEMVFRDEEALARVPPRSSTSPPPLPRGRGDPTIIPWAQHVGVDAQKMHVMQTSLFRMPEEAAALRALAQPLQPPQPARGTLRLPPPNLNRKHSRDSDGDGLRVDSREVCLHIFSALTGY